MDRIAQLREMLECLPDKDKALCNKFLDKRKFIEIREIVDSDVTKMMNKMSPLSPSPGEVPSNEYLELERKYFILKDLQGEIAAEAACFESDDEDDCTYVADTLEDYDF